MQNLKHLFLAAFILLLLPAAIAQAQGTADAFPSRPVVLVIPFSAGGPVELECRMYTPGLTSLLGQQVVIDFKPGGASMIGTTYVAKSKPDGHNVIVVSTSLTVLPAFHKDMAYDTVKDLTPISLMSRQQSALLVRPAFPARNLGEYLAYAKANPEKINYGTAGAGAISHLAGAWLHSLSGTKVTFVHHKSTGPMLLEIQSGRIDAGSGLLAGTMPMIKAGKVRALAVLGDQRSSQLPELATAAEQGVTGYNYSGWIGFLGAGGTPAPIVNKLSEAFARVVRAPDIVAELDKQGSVPVGSTPAQFRQVIATELVRWKKVVDDAGLKLEE